MGGLEGAGRWQQVSLWCADWQATEKVAITHLGPQLTAAEIITLWWFVRKGASWRVRCLPVPGRDEQMSLVLKQTMRDLVTGGSIPCWTMTTTYEPETHAFGGPDGMDLAHQLFHADSRHLLSHLRQARDNYRRELGLRLANQLMLAAGQDWYEQGDVWARVAAHRLTGQPPPESKTAMAAVHRLMTAPLNSSHSPLAAAPDWLAAFQRAGPPPHTTAWLDSLIRAASRGGYELCWLTTSCSLGTGRASPRNNRA